MVIALLLAQLVLPSPPSGPIQPPGMICASGDCEGGPMVYRTSTDRAGSDHLEIACDMTSGTCSNGRKIITTRATPVPCETSPGVWEIIPANVGCYSVRGLESWEQTASYLSYGAELDRSPWAPLRGGIIEALPDGYRITNDPAQTSPSGIIQGLGSLPAEGAVTLACIVRTQGPIAWLTLEAGTGVSRSWTNFDTQGQWETISVSGTVAAGASRWVGIAPRGPDLASVDVQACWYTRFATLGRPCWGGEAPVTCARDRHTISTEGWPTKSGEIQVGVRLEGDASNNRAIIDGMEDATFRMAIQTNNAIRLWWNGLIYVTAALPWEYGRTYVLKLVFDGSTISMYRDGVFLRDFTYDRPMEWAPDVSLGPSGTAWHLNGSISSLYVRSFE